MSEDPAVYEDTPAMEPLMPLDATGGLREKAARLLRLSAKLEGGLHPITRAGVAEQVRQMNSYYSNLIEGHHTHPLDLEKALQHEMASDPARRALQLESKAHVEVQRLIENRIDKIASVCSADFLLWLHGEFYRRMPEELHRVQTTSGRESIVQPGAFRLSEVQVGTHFGVRATSIPAFMRRFEEYEPAKLDPLDRVIGWAASHHRLAWVHPFLDGNGRVARLFSDTYARRIEIGSSGLWSISRGLARNRDAYLSALANADRPRQNDFDGRGNLSDTALVRFCEFFLNAAIDQVEFMSGLLQLDTLQERILLYGERWAQEAKQPPLVAALLRDLALRGEISRGEVPRLLETSSRTASRITALLLQEGLVQSKSHRDPLRLAFGAKTVGYYLPRLYPEGLV